MKTKKLLLLFGLLISIGILFSSVTKAQAAGYCSPATMNVTQQGCRLSPYGYGECFDQSVTLGCYRYPTSNGTSCISDQYYVQCSDGFIDINTGEPTWCSFGLTGHDVCGSYVSDTPPSGGYGCVGNTCSWTSWGTYTTSACGTGCGTAPTCGDRVVNSGEACDDGPTGSPTCTSSCTIPEPPAECGPPNSCVLPQGCFAGNERPGTCESGKICCYTPPPNTLCSTYQNYSGFQQGFLCESPSLAYDGNGVQLRSCSYSDMVNGRWRIIDEDITEDESKTVRATSSCNTDIQDGYAKDVNPATGLQPGSGLTCIAQCSAEPLDLCLLELNNHKITRLDNPSRFSIQMYNLPSICGYGITEADRFACRDNIPGNCTYDNDITRWRLGTLDNLSHPKGRYCEQGCVHTACDSNGTDAGNPLDFMEIGAENNSGWKWEDVAKYSNRTAASDPVAIACKGWLGGIGRESSVLPITRRLGKAWGGVSEPCVQRGDPITFAFTITDADAVPPEVRLHTYKTNNKYGSPDGWWGIFWSRYIVWLEPGANLGGSVIADIPDRLLHGCTMNKSDAFTWIFDCLAPTSDEYERDPNDPDTIQTNYGTHSVVFSNQYNVETEVTYELAETCPILPGTPTDLTASCQAADTMRLSWTAVPEATMYRVHVDDGVLGDTIAAVGYGDDNTCLAPYDTLDTCVYTSNIYLDVQVADAATFDQANWSVFAVNDDGMSEESAVSVLKSCIPNCRDIEGPPSVTQGDTALYSAIFESAHGFLGGTFSVKGITDTSYSADMQWPSRNFGDATILTQRSDGVFSWDTTGVEPGRYNLYCRAWNDGKAECIGDSTTIPTPPVYACAGGVSSMEVEVLPPEITISGTMYEGLGSGISGDLCVAPATPADGTPWNGDERSFWIGMDGLVPMPGTFPYLWRVGADGVYSISGVQSDSGVATVKARAFDLPDGYQFVCPANGQYSISTDGVTEDITGVNFFISQIGDPWWQARGGLVYSRWTVSNLPISASTGDPLTACANAGSDCTPYLVTGLLSGIAESAGLPLGPTTIPAGYGTNHPGDYGLVNDHTDAGLARENYAVLSRRFDLAAAQQITADTIAVAPSGAALQSDAEVYFSDHNLAIFLSGNWSISNADNDRKVVLFVDGDVVLTNTATESIKVPEGNFFAIIASGNITFSSDVGIPVTPGDTAAMYSLETEYEGVFIADGILTIDAYTDDSYAERKFIGAGSFVGWSGVNLPRNFEAEGVPLSGTLNNSVPTDTFIFRPDFILNTPELMKRSTFNWREINSITQE